MAEEYFYVSVDLESMGPIPARHAFVELGAVLVSGVDGTVVDRFSTFVCTHGYEVDPTCIRDFWAGQPRYEETLAESRNPKNPNPYVAADRFVRWCLGHAQTRKNIQLVSDNVAYDVSTLQFFAHQTSLTHVFGTYRPILDLRSAYVGMTHRRIVTKEQSKHLPAQAIAAVSRGYRPIPSWDVQYTHNPLHDAEVTARTWVWIQNQLAS